MPFSTPAIEGKLDYSFCEISRLTKTVSSLISLLFTADNLFN
jgi:hypothetical protein